MLLLTTIATISFMAGNADAAAVETYSKYRIQYNSNNHTWSSAWATCIANNGHLIDLRDNVMGNVLKHLFGLPEADAVTGPIWTGLHNVVPLSDSEPVYQWADCNPNDTEINWAKETGSGDCVVADQTYALMTTDACGTMSPFVCKEFEGSCTYDKQGGKKCVEPRNAVRQVLEVEMDEKTCKAECSQATRGSELCWAFERGTKTKICTLIFTTDPYVCETIADLTDNDLFFRNCFTFEDITGKNELEVISNIPVSQCVTTPGPTTTTETTSMTTTTITSSTTNTNTTAANERELKPILIYANPDVTQTQTSVPTSSQNESDLSATDSGSTSATTSVQDSATDPLTTFAIPSTQEGDTAADSGSTSATTSVQDSATDPFTTSAMPSTQEGDSATDPGATPATTSTQDGSDSATESGATSAATSIQDGSGSSSDPELTSADPSTQEENSESFTDSERKFYMDCIGVKFYTEEERQKRTEELVEYLILDRKNLSSYRRTKSSAEDHRITAKNVGGAGIFLLVLASAMIVVPDIMTVTMEVFKYKNKKKASKSEQQEPPELSH